MGRPDGRKIKTAGFEYVVGAHIMGHRIDAMNMITLDIPVEPMRHYLNKKRKEGKRYSHLALFLAAIVHSIAEYPQVNRFIVNKRLYARNEIAIGMVVLKGGKIDGVGATDKMKFKPESTLDDVNDIINSYIEKNRDENDVNGTDKTAEFLVKTPGLLRVGVNVAKWADKHNLLPKAVIDVSPFHATMMLTNLASINTRHIYHHIYDFGTTSLTMAIGKMRDVPKMKKGEVVLERCIPMGLVMDDRITSGAYYAVAFERFQQLLENPELLETPAVFKEDIP